LPFVPFDFDPPVDPEEDPRLIYEAVTGGTRLSWPAVGATVFLPTRKFWASLSEIASENAQTFIAHGHKGFSIGRYHEFFVTPCNETFAGFNMGGIEATFGLASPLAAAIFFGHHREKYFGGWSSIWTLRLFGAQQDDLEAAVISACLHYAHDHGQLPRLWALDDSPFYEWDDEEEESAEEQQIKVVAPPVTDLEPMRFYYAGLEQDDATAACIYFYRVIEFYSFLTHESEMKRLRHDGGLTDHEFSRRILDLVVKDEKGPIFRLVTKLADNDILARAKTAGLIQGQTATALAEGVYSFRNSIVHGKFSYGFSLKSTSLLEPDPMVHKWLGLIRELARRAIDGLGSRRF